MILDTNERRKNRSWKKKENKKYPYKSRNNKKSEKITSEKENKF